MTNSLTLFSFFVDIAIYSSIFFSTHFVMILLQFTVNEISRRHLRFSLFLLVSVFIRHDVGRTGIGELLGIMITVRLTKLRRVFFKREMF